MLIGEYPCDLLSCPFCGRTPKHWENTVQDVTIRCECGIRLSRRKPHRLKDEQCGLMIICDWNTRQPSTVTAHMEKT